MNPSTASARALVARLVADGVRHVVLCPGSRSTPLAYAVHDLARAGRLELHVRHDERVAGFTALGLGRVTGRPAAVVTTSGTAVANLLPAVLEAHHSAVPLLVLAADRPARLRGTWANQTSDLQAGLLVGAARHAGDLPGEAEPRAWADAAGAAMRAAWGLDGRRAGPAVLDLGFDDPLLPGEPGPWVPDAGALEPAPGALEPEPTATPAAGIDPSGAEDLVQALQGGRTVVVAGDGAGPDARRFAEAWGLPLLAEPTSGSRGGPNLVAAYRLLLDEPQLGGQVGQVVAFGRPTLSRPVTRLLGRPDVRLDVVQRHPDDPAPDRADVTLLGPAHLAAAVAAGPAQPATGSAAAAEWLAAWLRAGQSARAAVDQVLDGWPVLTGPLVAREVAELASDGSTALVLAASNAVRDMDLAGRGWPAQAVVLGNRGLSGIDGTVSTATGVALGGERPVCVLVGDVALLHDLGSLVLGPGERRPDLTVVVLNDAGGGIFSLLEPGVDAERDPASAERFERVFGTPHAVDLAPVCAGLGVPYQRVASAAGLREQLARPAAGLRLVEVRTDRADLRPLHEALARAVQQAVRPSG